MIDPIYNEFLDWLRRQGADLLPTTNSYEVARFVAQGKTNVVYRGRRGVSANGFAHECWEAFRNGQRLSMGAVVKPRDSLTKRRAALLERDGDLCFFCAKPLDNDITIEHLVSRHKQGPDCDDNLALAHENCNKDADNLPLVKKIQIYCKSRFVEQTSRIGS